MVPLDRALVSSYRRSIVTMPLTEAVWPQIAMQVVKGAVSTPVWREWGVVWGPNWYHGVAVGQLYLLL